MKEMTYRRELAVKMVAVALMGGLALSTAAQTASASLEQRSINADNGYAQNTKSPIAMAPMQFAQHQRGNLSIVPPQMSDPYPGPAVEPEPPTGGPYPGPMPPGVSYPGPSSEPVPPTGGPYPGPNGGQWQTRNRGDAAFGGSLRSNLRELRKTHGVFLGQKFRFKGGSF